ncbi:tRNA-t(6)A37 methylthiotransferase [Chitinispirillum alkaliphilum]|nr:tRNA-t(6)A37 methylthiotransferase [Chitinispirillum alkaliphilum]
MTALTKTKTVALCTIGCRTNQEEMGTLKQNLLSAGYLVTDKPDIADVIIVNTCSVTALTESKTEKMIGSYSRDFPRAALLVTGCLAQQKKSDLTKFPGVKWVVGNREKGKIIQIIQQYEEGVFCPEISDGDVLESKDNRLHSVDPKKTRYSIKIQEGCSFQCAYCIVPSLRGPSRATGMTELLDSFKQAIDIGYKEIVLTGTHIGQYRDPSSGADLLSLIEEILKTSGNFRVRLSSIDPRDLTNELIEMIAGEEKICDHLHLSIQSFSPRVLERMNRPWREVESIVHKLTDLRKRNPLVGLGGDFIVGHPGETEEDFLYSLNIVEQLLFSYGHVFRYSRRPGTSADTFSDQLPETVKTHRSTTLREVLDSTRKKFLSTLQGQSFNIITESEMPVKGITSNYIKVRVPGVTAVRNTWLNVKVLESVHNDYCIAEPISRGEL